MAATATSKSMTDRKEDTVSRQRKANRVPPIRSSTLNSTGDPRPWQSTLRFQEITREIMSESKRKSAARSNHRSAPPTPASMAGTVSGSGKDRRYSFGNLDDTAADRASTSTMSSSMNLCKDCKTSLRESVCFITNDGRISAASTGFAFARNVHRCNVSGCAANRSHHGAHPSQKGLRSKPAPAPLNSRTMGGLTKHSSIATPSVRGCDVSSMKQKRKGGVDASSVRKHDPSSMKQEMNLMSPSSFAVQRCGEEGGEHHSQQTDNIKPLYCPPSTDETFLHDAVGPCSTDGSSQAPSAQPAKLVPGDGSENDHVELVDVCSPPATSCDTHDEEEEEEDDGKGRSVCADEDEKKLGTGLSHADDIRELNDFSSLLYHGDNEYSCSEDGGTNATTTPNSMIKGTFAEDPSAAAPQPSSRWAVARMRQRYLQALSEQEAERVRLRKQEVMARKQSGDWMLDCHMGEVLHRLAPNGEVRVKVLVEAFETVAQHTSDSESSQAP